MSTSHRSDAPASLSEAHRPVTGRRSAVSLPALRGQKIEALKRTAADCQSETDDQKYPDSSFILSLLNRKTRRT